jgi:hypothetical protein
MNESLTARADDADVRALAEKTGRTPEGIAARANALDRGELDREAETGRGRPFARALLDAPDALACALLANVDDDQAEGGEPEFSPGDWAALRAVVLAAGAEVEDDDGWTAAHLEWGWPAPIGNALVLGLDPENCVVVYTQGEPESERYIAAELVQTPAAVPA